MKFRLASLLLLPLLASCAASLPHSAMFPASDDQLAIGAAIASWRNAGMPWDQQCNEQYSRIRVVVSKPAEFTELCGRAPLHAGGKLYACNTEQYANSFPVWMLDDTRVPLLVISELQPEVHRRLLVVHETMHWLERCSGKGIDFDHEDEAVWQGARLEAQRVVLAALQERERHRGRHPLWSERFVGADKVAAKR